MAHFYVGRLRNLMAVYNGCDVIIYRAILPRCYFVFNIKCITISYTKFDVRVCIYNKTYIKYGVGAIVNAKLCHCANAPL